MKVKFKILYNNGKEEEFFRDEEKESVEKVADVFNQSFTNGLHAVVRLNNNEEAVLINVMQVSSVKIEFL